MAIAAYVTLLCSWLLFLPPALNAQRSERAAPVFAAAVGLLALIYELWMTFVWGPGVANPIRLDIFLVFWLLAAVYAASTLRIWGCGWRRTALAAGGLTLAASACMAASWIEAGRESKRLDALRDEGNRLLFEARFRNRAAYDHVFEMRGGADDAPIGHWQGEPGASFSRLIVNPAGHAYVFFHCGPTECRFGPGGQLRAREEDGTVVWEGEVVMRGVGQRRLAIAPTADDELEVRVDGRSSRFRRSPPPLLDLHPEAKLSYLGTFSAAEARHPHVRVSQLWLWRGDGELLAVAIFRVLLPGRRADYISPAVLGSGVREDGRWRFRFSEAGREREAVLRLVEGGVEVERPGEEERWPRHTAAPRAIFRDEIIELAPLTSVADWRHWFEVQLTAHFSSAEIPAL